MRPRRGATTNLWPTAFRRPSSVRSHPKFPPDTPPQCLLRSTRSPCSKPEDHDRCTIANGAEQDIDEEPEISGEIDRGICREDHDGHCQTGSHRPPQGHEE